MPNMRSENNTNIVFKHQTLRSQNMNRVFHESPRGRFMFSPENGLLTLIRTIKRGQGTDTRRLRQGLRAAGVYD